MGAVTYIPTPAAVEAAWERYAKLVRQANSAPRLWADRNYMEELTRAHRAFTDAFNAMERAA